MPNPHINPNPPAKAQALTKGRSFKDQAGDTIQEASLIYEQEPIRKFVRDIRVVQGKVQKEIPTHYLRSPVTGKRLEDYFEWIDA